MLKRADLPNSVILKALKENKNNVNRTRIQLNCSYRLVHDVLHGRRKDPGEWDLIPKPPLKPKHPCTCCGIREVKKGNRFLCEYCWQNEGTDMNELPVCPSLRFQHGTISMLRNYSS